MFGNLFISHTISPSLLPEAVLSLPFSSYPLSGSALFICRPDPVSDLKGRIAGSFQGSRQKTVIIKKAVLFSVYPCSL